METNTTLDLLTQRKQEAQEAHTQWSQYEGHWDGWVLGKVTNQIKTKLGTAFEAGDVVLVKPRVWNGPWSVGESRTCYSFRNGIDTSVPSYLVTEI